MGFFDILGQNKRNLDYIRKWNPKKKINLANDKLQTKEFLTSRGIPMAKTFGVISSWSELNEFDFGSLEEDEFVIKPNRGSKGRGIYVVKILPKKTKRTVVKSRFSFIWKFLHPDFKEFGYDFKIGSNVFSEQDFKQMLVPILDGEYSIGKKQDSIMIEQKLVAGNGFEKRCEHGLSDLRIIVFNLVPILSMLRMPTEFSGGKANLAQGGLGFGVDINNGKITSLRENGKTHLKQFPKKFEEFLDNKIPFWNDLLMYSSMIQFYVNIGYLGLDRVITNEGPKLLEINARPGLEIQNVNEIAIGRRIEKVQDMDVESPEKGVEISHALFSSKKNNSSNNEKKIYLTQSGTLKYKGDHDLLVGVDISKKHTLISKEVADIIGDSEEIDIVLSGTDYNQKLEISNFKVSKKLSGDKIILGTTDIDDFYIVPRDKIASEIKLLGKGAIIDDEMEDMLLLDEKVFNLTRKLSLSQILIPLNYYDEFDKFVSKNGNYNPSFTYKTIDNLFLNLREKQLLALKKQYRTGLYKSKVIGILLEKVDFYLNRIALMRAYKLGDLDKINHYQDLSYGGFDNRLLKISEGRKKLEHMKKRIKSGPTFNSKNVKIKVEDWLEENNITDINVEIKERKKSRFSISLDDQVSIYFSNKLKISEGEMAKLFAHELETHVKRYFFGSQTGLKILRYGTANYLIDEEGIAIYKSNEIVKKTHPEYGNYKIYYHYDVLNRAMSLDYKGLAELLISYRGNSKISYKNIFKKCFMIKQGTIDTSIIHDGTVFRKNKIYLDGYDKIKKRVEAGGKIDNLMIGKIKIEDLDYL